MKGFLGQFLLSLRLPLTKFLELFVAVMRLLGPHPSVNHQSTRPKQHEGTTGEGHQSLCYELRIFHFCTNLHRPCCGPTLQSPESLQPFSAPVCLCGPGTFETEKASNCLQTMELERQMRPMFACVFPLQHFKTVDPREN